MRRRDNLALRWQPTKQIRVLLLYRKPHPSPVNTCTHNGFAQSKCNGVISIGRHREWRAGRQDISLWSVCVHVLQTLKLVSTRVCASERVRMCERDDTMSGCAAWASKCAAWASEYDGPTSFVVELFPHQLLSRRDVIPHHVGYPTCNQRAHEQHLRAFE